MTGRPPKPINQLGDFIGLDFTCDEQALVQAVLSKYRGQQLKNVRKHIAKLKEHSVTLDGLENRIAQIIKLGRDSSSLRSLILRYGEDSGRLLFAKKNTECSLTREELVAKYGAEAERMLRLRGASLAIYIERHGEELGRKKWDVYRSNRAKAYALKHAEGYQFARYTEAYYVDLYGEEKGKDVFAQRISKQRYKVSQQRYIDDYGEEAGREMCRQIKTTVSKNAFLARFGNSEGLVQYNKHRDKVAASCNYSYASMVSTNFFSMLVDRIGIDPKECRYGSKSEQIFHLTERERELLPQRIVAVDFIIGRKIIEYNGDRVHANPIKFDKDSTPHPWDREMTAGEIWQRDEARCEILKARGFKVLVVWESEVLANHDDVITKCERFLKEG